MRRAIKRIEMRPPASGSMSISKATARPCSPMPASSASKALCLSARTQQTTPLRFWGSPVSLRWVSDGTVRTQKPFLNHACVSTEGREVYETSDPVRLHHQRQRKPCERDLQAD